MAGLPITVLDVHRDSQSMSPSEVAAPERQRSVRVGPFSRIVQRHSSRMQASTFNDLSLYFRYRDLIPSGLETHLTG